MLAKQLFPNNTQVLDNYCIFFFFVFRAYFPTTFWLWPISFLLEVARTLRLVLQTKFPLAPLTTRLLILLLRTVWRLSLLRHHAPMPRIDSQATAGLQ